MKRKRGHQKGKQKQPATPKDVDEKLEENPALDDTDNAELGSPMDVEPSPSEEDEPAKRVEILLDKPAGPAPGRVKVKLKSSKMLDVQLVHSDAQTQNDSDTLSPQMGLEKQGEGVNSEGQPSSARKTGSIKIKSSRGLGSLNTIINQMSSPGERSTLSAVDRYKQSYKREHKLPRQVSRYNEQELNAALTVIKKVMKMDAADPFNVPVDPVALGIPDYFDIIKTPMDFGTICKNLEHGSMYMNSKDVFKDVQYIWENCYRYNNKGDYIIELMKRVKKNFMKYWVAAGLYTEQSNRVNDATLDHDSGLERLPEDDYGKEKVFQAGGRRTNSMMSKQEYVGTPSLNGTGSIQVESAAQSTRERLHVKNTNSKHKKRRGHGINKHKSDCLCAVCVVRRRRREREENAQIVASQLELSEGNMSQEFRKEETFPETPGSEDESLYSDCSPGPETTVKFEEQGVEVKLGKSQQHASQHEKRGSADVLEVQKTVRSEHLELLQLGDRSGEEHNILSQSEEMENSGYTTQTNIQKGETPLQEREEEAQKQKQLELLERQNQTKMYKNLLCDENPLIMKLCGSLFSNDRKSFWSGPHSLVWQDTSVDRSSAIHAAVAMLMK